MPSILWWRECALNVQCAHSLHDSFQTTCLLSSHSDCFAGRLYTVASKKCYPPFSCVFSCLFLWWGRGNSCPLSPPFHLWINLHEAPWSDWQYYNPDTNRWNSLKQPRHIEKTNSNPWQIQTQEWLVTTGLSWVAQGVWGHWRWRDLF